VSTPDHDPRIHARPDGVRPEAAGDKSPAQPQGPLRTTVQKPRRVRFVWWVCGALAFVLAALIAFGIYSQLPRRTANAALMRRLEKQTIAQADDRPLDAKTWPQWRGQRRDGVATAQDLLVAWPEGGPKELWRVDGGDGYSSFAVDGGTAYTMIAGSQGRQYVLALDVKTGERRWERECGRVGGSHDYGGPRATPTLDGDRLYTLSSYGVLVCLNRADGSVVWEADLVKDHGGRSPRWGYATSPLVEGDLVYVMPGGKGGQGLAAFDKKNGKLAWSAESDVAGYSSPIAATIGGVRQIVYLTGERLLGVTPDEGKLLWAYKWADRFNVNAATPVLVRAKEGDKQEEYLFVSSGYEKGCALVKVSRRQGEDFAAEEVYSNNDLCCHFGSPVLYGDCLYAADEKRDLTCLEVKTGEVRWRARRGTLHKASVLRVDNHLLVLGEKGRLVLLDGDADGYKELARCQPFRDRCWTMPVLADGRLFLRDQSKIVCLDLRDPSKTKR
jgi:outer membrane protein assembly factor BamB